MNNEIFVANNFNNSVTVYGGTASGNVAPIRIISGASTGINFPQGIAVDTMNNEIFVANIFNNSVTVYGRTANGDVAPTRSISGASTGLGRPTFLAVTF
jgi:DNA-binding beta-propeller fold protein YncE